MLLHIYKSIINFLCKPPASMKGDYRYTERKYINISILCQIIFRHIPLIISIFIDINNNTKRDIASLPFYILLVLFLYFRSYKLLTGTLMFALILVKIQYWLSPDYAIVLFSPFFFLIFSATFIPSKIFLFIGYIFVFLVSYFTLESKFMEFLQTAPREEIVAMYKRSFSIMLQMLTTSFCHLLIGRVIQEKVCAKLLALKATVANQNQELQQVNQNLTKALESRESFILSFSHETRNPLNGIIGNLHLLSEVDLGSKKAREYLQKANICAKILNNILLTILDSRRTGQSAIDIHLKHQTVDMSMFIREIWTLCREIIRSKDILPILDVSPNFPLRLVFDSERITQVVMNLMNNAMKFTQKGYIKLSFDWKTEANYTLFKKKSAYLSFSNTRLEKEHGNENDVYDSDWFDKVEYEQKGLMLISVEDTGCGISEEHQNIIFDKFSQVNENPSFKNLGLGLGLWIAKAIAKLHGGEISVSSQERVGSCFTASIPTTSKSIEQVNQNSPQILNQPHKLDSGSQKESRRALVVEDFLINQNINSEMLKKFGFTDIEVASDGQEGLNIFKKCGPNYFDLVTMDLEMPIMKGKEAMTLIRKWEAENNITPTKIIVISGNAVEKEVRECLDSQGQIRADAFLTKPCSFKMLVETITRLDTEIKEQHITNRKRSLFYENQISFSRKRLKVLLADDDFFNLDILIGYSQKMDLEYLAAKDGEEACKFFEIHCETIDLILLDLDMPLINGAEACDKMRKKLETVSRKKCKIFLLSGIDKVTHQIASKFDGIIHKPLTFEKFKEFILNNL